MRFNFLFQCLADWCLLFNPICWGSRYFWGLAYLKIDIKFDAIYSKSNELVTNHDLKRQNQYTFKTLNSMHQFPRRYGIIFSFNNFSFIQLEHVNRLI